MVDGVLLLVDASEGPAAADALRAAQGARARLPVILVVNKVDRPDARVGGGRRRGLRALPRPRRRRAADRVSDRLLQRARRSRDARVHAGRTCRTRASSRSSTPCSSTYRRRLRPRASAAGARHEPRRVPLRRAARALPHPQRRDPRRRSRSPGAARDGTIERAQGHGALRHRGARTRAGRARPAAGEIVALAGHPRGDDRRDDRRPRGSAARCPSSTVDEPSLSVTIGDQHARRSRAQEGDRLTAQPDPRAPRRRARRQRLAARPRLDRAPRTPGRCRDAASSQLAMLVEMMRREGFELTVGKPEVLTKELDGRARRAGRAGRDRRPRGVRRRRHAAARAAQGPAAADGQPRQRLGAHGVPRPCARADRLPHRVPDRDARHAASSTTSSRRGSRGTASCARARRAASSPTAAGAPTAYALINLQERGSLFVGPGRRALRGDDRRRERAQRRPRRERDSRRRS